MDFRKNIKIYIVLSFAFAILTLLLFICKASNLSSKLLLDTGIIADYGTIVCGVLSTFFGFLSILLVIQSLNEQEKQNELQNIESRFFELLKIQRENVQEFQQKGKTGRRVAVDMFDELDSLYVTIKRWYSRTNSGIKNDDEWKFRSAQIAYLILFYGFGKNSRNHLKSEIKKIVANDEVYNELDREFLKKEITEYDLQKENNQTLPRVERKYLIHDGNQSRLGHYFRHLYQTAKFIDNQPSRLLSYEDKYFYLKTLRAQLSNYEQAIFLYNSLTYLGANWEFNINEENRQLITKYNLIKNIPQGFTSDLNPKIYFPNVFFEYDEEKTRRRIELEKYYS